MKILDNFKKFFVSGEQLTTDIYVGGNNLEIMSDNLSESQLQGLYKKSLYLFAGLDKIATVLMKTEYELYKILNTQGDAERIYEHELLDLLEQPNENQVASEFMRIYTINMKLSGESFIRKIRDDSGHVMALVNIRPDIVDVKLVDRGDGAEIVYIVHIGSGKTITLESSEIIHVKIPDPQNPLRGASLLRPILNRVTAEEKANALQNTSFSNQGRPDGILSVKGITSQSAADKLKRKIAHSFSGSNSSNRIAIITSDMSFQQVALSQKDMDFMESLKFIRDDILAGLGVPKELFTLEDTSNLSSGGDRGMNMFLQFTIEPLVKLLEDALNNGLIRDEFDEPLVFIHKGIIKEDRKALVDELKATVEAGILTPNEARLKLGYEEIDGADELKTNIPTVFNGKSYLYKKLKTIETVKEKVTEIVRKEFLAVSTPQAKKLYYKAMNSVTDQNIKKLEQETKRYFREQKARVKNAIDNLGKEEINIDGIFDVEAELANTKRLAMQTFPDIALRSGNAGLIPIKSFYAKVDDFTIDQELVALIEERGILFAQQVVGVTYDTIRKLITDGLVDGLGRDEVARNIYNEYENMTRVRAKRIAQTEGTNMGNLGLQQAFKNEPLVTGKEWISSRDGRVRDEHVRNDGVVVDKDVSFPNGERYPADNSVNCRCVIAPVIR